MKHCQVFFYDNDRNLHINGYLEYGDAGFNQPWSWHIIPNEWALAEMSIGVCNGYPEYIENDLDYWIDTVGQLCNWGSFIKEEIETEKDFFDDELLNLMDFACDQRNRVHFFYTLPFTKKTALVETTWISELNNSSLNDYDEQIDDYLCNHLNLRQCKIHFREQGAIPLFRQKNVNKSNEINIGSAGGMTRLSTGYTFLNIQEQSRYIRKNIENIKNVNLFKINSKYDFLDKILLRVLKNNPNEMGNIFFKVFSSKSETAINFLSNKSSFFEDLEIILKMPKWKFFKELI